MRYVFRHPRRTLGLTKDAPAQAWLVLKGDPTLPSGRFGLSSLKMFTPRLASQTWRGRQAVKRRVPILNLFNHTPTPVEEGYSVRVTQVEDFRGRKLTYDSHNGTDFVVPPGTDVVASANGKVATIRNEFNRGGLKIYVDHGRNLMSTYHHLAEALVKIGDEVQAGQVIAKAGYSGMDSIAALGAVPPHVHYNAIVAGVISDPFAKGNEGSLWKGGENRPRSTRTKDAPFTPSQFDKKRVLDLLDSIKSDERRRELAEHRDDIYRLAFELVIEATTYPTRFENNFAARSLFDDDKREERLQLPFSMSDFDTTIFADDARYRYTLFDRGA